MTKDPPSTAQETHYNLILVLTYSINFLYIYKGIHIIANYTYILHVLHAYNAITTILDLLTVIL